MSLVFPIFAARSGTAKLSPENAFICEKINPSVVAVLAQSASVKSLVLFPPDGRPNAFFRMHLLQLEEDLTILVLERIDNDPVKLYASLKKLYK